MNRIPSFVVLVLLSSCAWFNRVDPPLPATPEPGFPCGKTGLQCYDTTVNGALVYTHKCCDLGQVCGGHWPNVGCPVGACCDDALGAPPGEKHGPWMRVVGQQRDESP